jgi:hypothetical protein
MWHDAVHGVDLMDLQLPAGSTLNLRKMAAKVIDEALRVLSNRRTTKP